MGTKDYDSSFCRGLVFCTQLKNTFALSILTYPQKPQSQTGVCCICVCAQLIIPSGKSILLLGIFMVRLAAHVSNGWKSLIHPSSGKDIAKTKGVLFIELLWLTWGESEGRWRQISGLTNRNHIRLQLRIRLHNKLKSNNYSELTVVNVADIWRERNVWYQGRSRQRMKTECEIRE